jgi:hypothetical protein
MASIVSQGKSKTPTIERENFRDLQDVPERIRTIYLDVARKLRDSNHPLPMWVMEMLRKAE